MSAAGEGSTEPNLYFCPMGRNANESVLPCSTIRKAARPQASESLLPQKALRLFEASCSDFPRYLLKYFQKPIDKSHIRAIISKFFENN